MSLQKQPIDISFAKGLDQKTDPFRVPIGNFLRLQNQVFNKGGLLSKRNGYGQITALPSPTDFLTTFNGNLTAVGDSLLAYIQGTNKWVNKGSFHPLSLSVLPMIRSNTNQTQVDAVTASNNVVCTVFTDVGPSAATTYKYAVLDSITGQNILPPAAIPSNGTVTNAPRVFLLGNYFVIVFGMVLTATNHLQYVVISTVNPVAPTVSHEISAQYTPSTGLAFDGFVANNSLYMAWNGSDGGGAIRMAKLDGTLLLHSTVVQAGSSATLMSVTADISGPTANIYISFWDSGSTDGFVLVRDQNFLAISGPTQIINNTAVLNITAVANNQVGTIFYEVSNNYSYDSGIPTHFINSVTCTQAGTPGSPVTIIRSLGLASKAFLFQDMPYMMGIYFSNYQPTYFLINSSGQIVSKLAYSNAGAYLTHGLPNAMVRGNDVSISYQFKDLIIPVNKAQDIDNTAGVYAQTGLNYITYTFGTESIPSEIGGSLELTGGLLWMYDGYSIVENGFNVWPDNVEVTTATTGGFLEDQQYFYQAIYEWTDNQGNIHRSAPSVPVGIVTTGGDTSANTVFVPTLRLTYKTSNPVKIVIYRWSVNQQAYYQVTSVTNPLLNNVTVDSVSFVDTQVDADILGNSIIYTTGGIIENIGAPSFNAITLFDDRLWGIAAEDPNLLWYSKQVIEQTPVEMSDLFTIYVAPSISAQGSTGPSKCIAPMDDKLIIFKRDAMYYINGSGPDNTGTNSQYSQPTFIASTVGCSNQQSIVFSPAGLMFQSDKGIWLLDRSLNTQYIGAAVEDFTQSALVQSAVNVPETTQIRFTLDSGVTLMYDYYYQQWGTFVNVPANSSTLYQNLHTYLDQYGRVYQETPGRYLDGSQPVLQGFSTSWISAAGLQGFQRAYFMHLLGTYISPHKLNIQIAYDFDYSKTQTILVTPDNSFTTWGSTSPWGSTDVWGGETNVEQMRIFFERQKCQSFQIIVDEVYDPSFGSYAGAGLTLSGINLTIGVKKLYPTLSAVKSFG